MIAKALQNEQIGFHLLHCGPSPVSINTLRRGVYEGVSFEYTTSIRRPENRLARLFVYFRAVLVLTMRLIQLREADRRTLVYLYVMAGPLNLYVGLLCRLLSLPVLQELCEWLPGEPSCSAFTRWLHRKSLFKRATGTLVISRTIEQRVRERCSTANPTLLIHRIPALVDTQRFAAAPSLLDESAAAPNFVYCGTTWLRDVFFLIRAFQLVRLRGYQCKLRIVGQRATHSNQILEYAKGQGLSEEDLILMGSVDEETLAACYKTAAGLLLPLPDDDRSLTRLPNKLSEYLASGRPVVTCRIGDLTEFLADNTSAYFATPGSVGDFAARMIDVLREPDRAARIGAAGQQVCLARLDYRVHAGRLAAFIRDCIHSHAKPQTDTEGKRKMSYRYLFFRNCLCCALALWLIATGKVRRARQHALSGGVVTGVYFHNPKPRHFTRCINWLVRQGYAFVSERDVLDMLVHGKQLPSGAVWVSFDDGSRELLGNALPMLCERGIPATIFLPTGIVSGDGLFPWLNKSKPQSHYQPGQLCRDAMTVAEAKELASSREFTIGSHTVSHTPVSLLEEREVRFEVEESKRILESWTQAKVECLAYPEGLFSGAEKVVLAECGYQMAATTENDFITANTDPYLVPRYNVPDDVWFPEAICHMVGVWRPAIEPIITVLRSAGRFFKPRQTTQTTEVPPSESPQSVCWEEVK